MWGGSVRVPMSVRACECARARGEGEGEAPRGPALRGRWAGGGPLAALGSRPRGARGAGLGLRGGAGTGSGKRRRSGGGAQPLQDPAQAAQPGAASRDRGRGAARPARGESAEGPARRRAAGAGRRPPAGRRPRSGSRTPAAGLTPGSRLSSRLPSSGPHPVGAPRDPTPLPSPRGAPLLPLPRAPRRTPLPWVPAFPPGSSDALLPRLPFGVRPRGARSGGQQGAASFPGGTSAARAGGPGAHPGPHPAPGLTREPPASGGRPARGQNPAQSWPVFTPRFQMRGGPGGLGGGGSLVAHRGAQQAGRSLLSKTPGWSRRRRARLCARGPGRGDLPAPGPRRGGQDPVPNRSV